MAIENVIESWKEVRNGLIDEANQIPADKFSFQPTPDTRSVKQLLQHLVESQKFLVGEACRSDTNLMRGSFRSEERRVGKECRSRWSRDQLKKKREDDREYVSVQEVEWQR